MLEMGISVTWIFMGWVPWAQTGIAEVGRERAAEEISGYGIASAAS